MSIVVGVRVRPFNAREKDRNSICCIEMPGGNQTEFTMIQVKKRSSHLIIVFGLMMVFVF